MVRVFLVQVSAVPVFMAEKEAGAALWVMPENLKMHQPLILIRWF